MTDTIQMPIEFTPSMKQALDVYYKRCEYRNESPTDAGRYHAIVESLRSDHVTEEEC